MLASSRPKRINEQYLKFLREKPCILCHAQPPSDPHHMLSRRWREAFRDDMVAIPLCREDHQRIESIGVEQTLKRYGHGPKYLMVSIADLLVEYFS